MKCISFSRAAIAVAIASLSCFRNAARAVIVIDTAPSSAMIGGNVTCTFTGGPMATAPILSDGLGGIRAMLPGSFDFRVDAGDSSLATWHLQNLQSAGDIVRWTIDLTTTPSLFDNGSLPSTPDSFAGVPGIVSTGGPVTVASTELNLWTNPSNLGDMYTAERADWGGFLLAGITPGASATWTDDTDLVPEPSSLALAAIGLAALLRRSKR